MDMSTLHFAPNDSAGGDLRVAVRAAGRDDEVVAFLDDLGCGPIASDDTSARAAWWAQFCSRAAGARATFTRFWDRAASFKGRILVWFSRHSASELAFFLAWTDRLRERPYDIVDVTGRELSLQGPNRTVVSRSLASVSIIPSYALQPLLGTERPITAGERDRSCGSWRRLCSENAPFRIVTEAGLVSTSVDHFDPLLLAQATPEWQPVAHIIAATDLLNSEPYDQIGNVMLHARLMTLVGDGKLVADGDPRTYSARVRLPG